VIKDKRKAKRIAEKAPAAISPSGLGDFQTDKKITRCLTEDISIKGMKIQSESFFPMNSTLRIQLSLKERSRAIKVVGKIRWIRKLKVSELYEMGIEIVETSKKDQVVLERHIEDSPQMAREERRPWKANPRPV
jgi:c-di-GMP-binding flagellar brake protein YcgR